MSADGETNAMIRTTTAITQLSGSDTINTLPRNASGGLSVRILPNESVDEAVTYIKKMVGSGVDVSIDYRVEPPAISDYRSKAFSVIAETVKSIYPQADVTPFLMSGGTDSKHFTTICRNVYRFGGFALSAKERQGVHAANESLRVSSFMKGIEFYIQLLRAFNDREL
jgi:carboxypeptidase PM20D1